MEKGGPRLHRPWLGAALVLALASCAEGGGAAAASTSGSPTVTPTPSPSPPATCDAPARTKIEVVAKNFHFNVECLVVPAGEPVTVTFRNLDSVQHNLSVYTLDFSGRFTGDLSCPHETLRYAVPALEPGQYLFQCDIHPRDMSGPLIVE